MTRETKIPAIPDIRADNVVDVLRAIKSGLDVREARVGDPLDQMVTLRDLADLRLVLANVGRTQVTGGGNLPVVVPGVNPDGYNPATDLMTPPQPTGLTASGTFTNVYLSWDGAPYRNHAYTQIWRSQTNVLGNAVLVGVSSTNLFTDPVQENQTYYYWIRFVSQANIIGAYNATSGTQVTTSENPAGVIAALEGQILASTLSSALATRIDLIDAPASVAGSVNQRVAVVQSQVNDLLNTPTYDNATTYQANTTVTYNGSLYRALQTTTGNLPTNATYWEKIGEYASLGDAVAAHTLEIGNLQDDLASEVTARSLLATQMRGDYTGNSLEGLTQGLLYDERVARSTAVESVASSVSTLSTSFNNAVTRLDADILSEQTTRSNADSALASSIYSLQSTASGLEIGKSWNFDADVEGFVALGGTVTWSNGALQLNSSGTDPALRTPGISIAGSKNYLLRMRIKRVAGSGWDGTVYYTTAGHGESETYRKQITNGTATGEWRILEWDMSDIADWVGNTVINIRFDLGNTAQDQFLIDWVSIGRVAPQPLVSQATLTNNYYTKTDTDSAISSATQNLVSSSALTNALSSYATTATLTNDYYTKTQADNAISSATQNLVSTTALNNALGSYATTATLTNNYYTKTSTDSAIATSSQVLSASLSGGFDVGKAWNFDTNEEGFTVSGATISSSGGAIRINSSGNDPVLMSPAVSLAGATNYVVRMRVKRLAGTTWQGDIYYTTAGHAYSESYKKRIADTTVLNEWRVLEWDMSSLTAGGADWVGNTITAIRFDIGTTAADQFEIDWISVGRVAPVSYTAAIAQEATVRSQADGSLFAQYTVKIDNNGYVAGFGLASQTVNGIPTSSFMVRADSFSIVNPDVAKVKINSATMYSSWFGSWTQIVTNTAHGLAFGDYVSITDIPEIVGQHQVTAIVDATTFSIAKYSYPGYTVSANSSVALVTAPFVVTSGKVYIRSAVIANASITNAQIASVTADKITTGTLTATIGVSTGKIYGGVNPNWAFGSVNFGTGFYVGNDNGIYKLRVGSYDKNLTWDGNDLTVRGIIYASGGLIGGIAIDAVGIRAGQSAWNTGSGFYLGSDGKFSLGTANSKYLTWDGSTLKFSGNLEAAGGTFSGALSAATGTFSGSLTAGTVDLNSVIGQSFTFATAGTYTAVTMPYTGTVRVKLLGGGGGGGGGRGNTDERTETSGLSGAYGNQYSITLTNVPKDYVVKVVIAEGGAGGVAGAVGSAGNPTFVQIFDPYGTLYAQYSASGGAGGGHYRYNDNGDSGLNGGLVARANGHSFRFPDAGDGAGWGSGQIGLAAPDIPGSAGGQGGFYDKENVVYWGSLTEARRGDLNGGNGVRGGGGGGGMATRGRAFSNGGMIGYRSAVYDSVNGGAESNGGKGGDGYAFVEIFNPNGVVLSSEFQTLKAGLQADFSVGVYNWSAVYTNNNPGVTSETIDILTSYGHGSYWLGYSSTPTGAITLSAYQGAGWTKPSGNTAVPKYTITYDDYGTYTSYLRVIYKANFKVIGAI
jgi:Domain of unknown function (DUF1983)